VGTVDTLAEVVARLRGEQGCAWDRAQTEATFRPYLLEEAYEADDALRRADDVGVRDELGDLLFILVMLAKMAEDRGAFTLAGVERGVVQKLIRRHPHLFEGAVPGGLAAWEAIKAGERAERTRAADPSALDGVALGLPALLRAQTIGRRAASVGFDWPDATGPRAKIDEELRELDEAVRGAQEEPGDEASAAVVEEFGDVLFSLTNLARHLGVSAETALASATAKFEDRFRRLEAAIRAEGGDPRAMDAQALEARWQAVKRGGGT
jgi:ATP diphosphatase